MQNNTGKEFKINTLFENDNDVLNDYYNRINKLIIDLKKGIKKNVNYKIVELYYEIGHIINELMEKYRFEALQNKIIKIFSDKLTKTFGNWYLL